LVVARRKRAGISGRRGDGGTEDKQGGKDDYSRPGFLRDGGQWGGI